MTGESVDVEALLAEARKALRCLYIAVDESIARDVSAKVEAALAAATARAEAAEAREAALRAGVEARIDEWRYKGEFGWGAWQEGHGPDFEGQVLDDCATRLRTLLATGGAG